MPSGYTIKRRVGSIVRSAGAILAFVQTGDTFLWLVPVNDVAVANPGTAAVTRTLTVPVGIIVEAILTLHGQDDGTTARIVAWYWSALTQTDSVPATGIFDLRTQASVGVGVLESVIKRIFTNTSAQIRSRANTSDANTAMRIHTHGWIDRRGRDD